MNKTLHKANKKNSKICSTFLPPIYGGEVALSDMEHSMEQYLQNAAKDTLHPRPEAVLELLRKAGI